jgi:hypothetical protein
MCYLIALLDILERQREEGCGDVVVDGAPDNNNNVTIKHQTCSSHCVHISKIAAQRLRQG